jgi:hypothetical protein
MAFKTLVANNPLPPRLYLNECLLISLSPTPKHSSLLVLWTTFKVCRSLEWISVELSQTKISAMPTFEILEWYPQYQSCLRYFLDHAQHSAPAQILCASLNIELPCQRTNFPVLSWTSANLPDAFDPLQQLPLNSLATSCGECVQGNPEAISLIPYIRRLVCTRHDDPSILFGFFGGSWHTGVGPLHEIERRNFLMAAKSLLWAEVKLAYDKSKQETVPFLAPLSRTTKAEVVSVKETLATWSNMRDWRLGPWYTCGMRREAQLNSRPLIH